MDKIPPKRGIPAGSLTRRLNKELLCGRPMEYEYERDEYSVAEFYRKFGSNLPQVVIITAGFHGEVFDDVFDRGEVIRIHDVSKQRRVVARGRPPSNLHISIPRSFSQPLCILDKHGKPTRLESINDLITKYSFPQCVQFPPDCSFSVGTGTVHTNLIGPLTLTEAFDEMFLMGNILTTGVIAQEVVHVPLYLSKLRLSICKGIKGKTRDDWLNYLNELHLACANIEYKRNFGSPHVAVYDPHVVHEEHYESYSYVEPTNYTSVGQIKKQLEKSSKPTKREPEADIYDHISEPAASNRASARPHRNPPPTPKKPIYDFHAKNAANPAAGRNTTVPVLTKVPTKVPTKDDDKSTIRPALPDRRNRPPLTYPKSAPPPSEAGLVNLSTNMYSNDIPRTAVQPLTDDKARHVMGHQRNNRTDVSVMSVSDSPEAFQVQITNSHASADDVEAVSSEPAAVRPAPFKEVQDVPYGKPAIDVASLSIEQLGEYLKQLRLEKYVERFSDDMIDGAIVQELSKDMLKAEYGMREIELVRLVKFIHEGHVPR